MTLHNEVGGAGDGDPWPLDGCSHMLKMSCQMHAPLGRGRSHIWTDGQCLIFPVQAPDQSARGSAWLCCRPAVTALGGAPGPLNKQLAPGRRHGIPPNAGA